MSRAKRQPIAVVTGPDADRIRSEMAVESAATLAIVRADEQARLDAAFGPGAVMLVPHPDGYHRHAEVFGDLIDEPFTPLPIVNPVTPTVSRSDAQLCAMTLAMLAREGRPGADWMERVAEAMRKAAGK